MQLLEVNDPVTRKQFLEINALINKDDPNYIRPLDTDINNVFDPKKNKAFRHGECIRWILKDDSGKLIGRIAAFTNKSYKNKGDDVPIGGVGFFDCINDQDAAKILFDAGRNWLTEKGMQAMDGPINFGERDRWWGLMVEGFIPPVYCMNYNQPYYQSLFEQYGFELFFNQLCFGRPLQNRLQPKFYERHQSVSSDPDFHAEHIRKNNLEKYAEDFTTIYNKAWAGHGGLKKMNKEVVMKMLKQMKPVMDEKIIWFAYYKNEPIGMWVNLPDLNQWFKHLNGRFDWFGKLKFLWIKATKRCSKFTGIVFGIVPEFQGKGIDSFMIVAGANLMQQENLYDNYEMQWIGDFNPKMINIAKTIDTEVTRRLVTYRYLFDRNKEFKRHPMVS
jgi:hypothetical protein